MWRSPRASPTDRPPPSPRRTRGGPRRTRPPSRRARPRRRCARLRAGPSSCRCSRRKCRIARARRLESAPVKFTTRPELRGTFGMVASTHWLASSTGMSVLERGGNAFDAAVAAGFALQVVEPHLNGPGGEMPAILFAVDCGDPLVLCGQGVAPAAATIERFRALGHELIPGTGVLAACVPGAFGGWLLLLQEFGTWRLEDVLAFAIGYAEHGFAVVPGLKAGIERHADLLATWPATRDLYLPAPEVGSQMRNRALAATYRRVLDEARGRTREQEIEEARRVFYEGFVAEEIDRFCADAGGLLT